MHFGVYFGDQMGFCILHGAQEITKQEHMNAFNINRVAQPKISAGICCCCCCCSRALSLGSIPYPDNPYTSNLGGGIFSRRVPPCVVKTCAVRPVFARVVGELRAADPSHVQGPVKQNASPGNNPRLRDEGGSRGSSRTQDQKTRTVSTCWSNPGGISLIFTPQISEVGV